MSYESYIEEIQPNLKGFVKSKIIREHDAEDIVQETNIILINKKSEYDESKNFKAWAFTIAHWQIKAYFKKLKRCKEVPYVCQDENAGDRIPEGKDGHRLRVLTSNNSQHDVVSFSHNSPVAILEGKEQVIETLNNIKKSKNSLNKTEREIIELTTLNYKAKDIAKILKMPQGSVSATKFRAIKKMKRFIPPQLQHA